MSEKERISLESHPELFFYLVGLGIIEIVILWIFSILWREGIYYNDFWGYLTFFGVLLGYVLSLILPAYGAYSRKKWGLIVNYIFLGLLIPFFIVFPLVMVWIIPHVELVLKVERVVGTGVSIAIFDIYYLAWMIQNRKSFT